MSLYGKSNRQLIESELLKGTFADNQVVECDIDDIVINNIHWERSHLRNLNANRMSFISCDLRESTFAQANLTASTFAQTLATGVNMECLTLIKSKWTESLIDRTTIKYCTVTRSAFSKVQFVGSTLCDLECVYSTVSDCVFLGCLIENGYALGTNGFSGARIANTIFSNCRFSGFPLRGARLENCVFHNCSGEIGDEMECDNVVGLALHHPTREIAHRTEAEELLRKLNQRKEP